MNFKYRTFFVVMLLILLLGSIVSAVYAVGGEDSSQETEFKTITIALSGYPLTLDPVGYADRDTQTLIRLFSEGLNWARPDGVHVPDLAKSIVQLDEVTYEIKIREDVYFHNGDHMTADDVIFSILRMGAPGGAEGKTARRHTLAGPVKTVNKIDDYTIKVIFEKPNIERQKRNWYHFEIWPKKYFEEVGIEGFMKHPIGVGPFKWVEGDLRNQVVLERFENYYGGCPEIQGEVDRIPVLDRVIVKFITEPATRVAALLSGDVDIIQNIPFDSIKLLEQNPDIRVVPAEVATKVSALKINTSKAPFNDKRVRQAIAYAINYELLTEKLLLGYSSPLYARPWLEPFKGMAGSGQFGNISSIKGYEYDPEKAKALLAEAGVSELSLIIDTPTETSEEAQVIAQMLGDVGIDASVRTWDFGVLNDAFLKGNRDIYYLKRGFARRGPEGIYTGVITGGTYNHSFYSNKTLDDLFKEILAMADSPERNALLIKAYEIILEDLPIIWVHEPVAIDAVRSNVENYYTCTGGRINLQRVDIK